MKHFTTILQKEEKIFNKDIIMNSLDNDMDLYALIAEEFCNSKEKRHTLIRIALGQNKVADLERELHTLKGLFYTFGAKDFGEKAKSIELTIRDLNVSIEEIQKSIDIILNLDDQLVKALKEDLQN